ncbi:MAG TPA: flagellar biosynthetic protein FliR [Terracidiphilus sp.]|nr:flagellar biosynthetic protein FliR [Terracidiphilus sp.]
MRDWPTFLSAMVLALVRVSGVVTFAPFFSSDTFPMRVKAGFALAVAFLLAPLVASLPGTQVNLGLPALMGELAVGLIYGLSLALLNEMLLFAGQIAGMQFSFSLVNLLDPNSPVQTPLLGTLFTLMGTLVLIAAGLDRVLLASLIRSFHAVPLGSFVLLRESGYALVTAASGVFLAALELAAPVLAATMLVELSIGLMGKLSPQLPVMSLTVPLKTLTGFVILLGSLALWPRFIQARFDGLLDLAQQLLVAHARGG